jgi:hypothetical protein
MGKMVKTTSENETGRNVRFRDEGRHVSMTRGEFVSRIEGGGYPDYHIRIINGVKTPVSNPDRRISNNLDG